MCFSVSNDLSLKRLEKIEILESILDAMERGVRIRPDPSPVQVLDLTLDLKKTPEEGRKQPMNSDLQHTHHTD